MANEGRFLFTVNNVAPVAVGAMGTAGVGTWALKAAISCRAVFWKSSSENKADLAGLERGAVAAWDNKPVPALAAVEIACNVPIADSWQHVGFVYQEAAAFDPASPAKICTATVQYTTATQAVITVLDDDDTGVVTFGAAPTAIGVSPIWASNVARDNIGLSHDGAEAYRRSFVQDIENLALNFRFEAGSLTQAQYSTMRQWAQYGVKVKAADGDTGARIGTYHGWLVSPAGIDSYQKNADYPALTMRITGEEYN